MSALTPVNFKASVCFMLMKGGGGGVLGVGGLTSARFNMKGCLWLCEVKDIRVDLNLEAFRAPELEA